MPMSSTLMIIRNCIDISFQQKVVELNEFINLPLIVEFGRNAIAAILSHSFAVVRPLHKEANRPGQISSVRWLEKQAVLTLFDETSNRWQVARHNGQTAGPVFEHLRGNILHELGNWLQSH